MWCMFVLPFVVVVLWCLGLSLGMSVPGGVCTGIGLQLWVDDSSVVHVGV